MVNSTHAWFSYSRFSLFLLIVLHTNAFSSGTPNTDERLISIEWATSLSFTPSHFSLHHLLFFFSVCTSVSLLLVNVPFFLWSCSMVIYESKMVLLKDWWWNSIRIGMPQMLIYATFISSNRVIINDIENLINEAKRNVVFVLFNFNNFLV